MKAFRIYAVAGTLLCSSPAVFASEYADFLRDATAPYGHYRQSLSLTSGNDAIEKSSQAVQQFIQGWDALAGRYAADPPKPFARLDDFPAKLKRPVEVGREALALLKDGRSARAHTVLEEVRYILWDLRVRAGINSITDRANDYHEAMEVILDHVAKAKDEDDLNDTVERYGAWLTIKWEELALAGDLALIRKDFDPAFSQGRKVLADYLAVLRKGDVVAAKAMSGQIKGAYKKVWSLDPR